jgi:hypothetical protein
MRQATAGLLILGLATYAYLWSHAPDGLPPHPEPRGQRPRRGDRPDDTVKVGGRPGLPLESFGANMSNLLETSVWF